MSSETKTLGEGLLATLMAEEAFRPAAPQSLEETGLTSALVEALICKNLALVGTCSGRGIAEKVCLPFGILEGLFQSLRTRQIIVHTGSAPVNDYYYSLTEQGRDRTRLLTSASAYVGAAPVPLMDYVLSVDAQTIRAEAPKRSQLTEAFSDISVDTSLFESLGPAVNSGAGLFLYGAPGNGKSTLARRITSCFGQHIWVPRTLIEDGQLIKLYDNAYHEAVDEDHNSLIKSAEHDQRWIKIRRPTVVVGGELTMDNLEIRHDPVSNVGEAPLQLKSNCGCLLIDDFGRQRVEPAELLNRWIIPLENRHDFLTLSTGKKFQVPFEQLIIFSTNLEPSDLVDDAFLRRIPYKIEIGDPSEQEFHDLFDIYAQKFGCECRHDVVDYLLNEHYHPNGRPLRRCQPRDLLTQVRNYCTYNDLPLEMEPAYFDHVVRSYFTVVLKS
ncbi:MAG: AAA family ATPase [Pirellulales bacterium]|nr:AAA family ATPase [Pirellulales bacterium]